MKYTRLWVGLTLVVLISFSVLAYYGKEIYNQAPPIPDRVVTPTGQVLFTGSQISDGQNVWQSTGGQECGTVWGHGAYVAPDWSADFIHRESVALLDRWAVASHGVAFSGLNVEDQAALQARLQQELRTNTYDPETHALIVSEDRAVAIKEVCQHYSDLFGHAPALQTLRNAYAIPPDTIKNPVRQAAMNSFFFWAAWVCETDRPGDSIT